MRPLDTHCTLLSIHQSINPAFHRSDWPPIVAASTSSSRAYARLQLNCYPHTLYYRTAYHRNMYLHHEQQLNRPLTILPGNARCTSDQDPASVPPRQTADKMSPAVQLSLRLATPETILVNRARSPDISAPHRLRRMLLRSYSVRRHRHQRLLTSSLRTAENFWMLKHGVSPSSSTATKL